MVRLALLLVALVGVLLLALLLVAGAFLLLLAVDGLDGLGAAAVALFVAVGVAAASPSFFFVVARSPLADDATEAFVSGLTRVFLLLVIIPSGTTVSVSGLVLMNHEVCSNECKIRNTQQQRSIM